MEERSVGVPLVGARARDVITVVVTADNHLGCRGPRYRAFGQHARVGDRGVVAQERLRRLRRAFQQATDFAVGQGVDLFIQVGDLFDTPSPTEQDRSFVAACLAELRQAGVRTFAVSGVHDTSIDSVAEAGDEDDVGEGSFAMGSSPAPQVSYARLGALHYFPPLCMPGYAGAVEGGGFPTGEGMGSLRPFGGDDARRPGKVVVEPVMVDVRGMLVALCGLSVVAGQEGDPLARVDVGSEVERAALSLLLLHAPIEGVVAEEEKEVDGRGLPVVARSTIAGQSSFHVILAGYHHGYRRVQIGSTDVIVAGATQQMDFRDPDDEPGFVFLGFGADGVRWCQHIPVEGARVRRLVIDVAELWRSFAVAQSLPLSEQRRDDRGTLAQSLPLNDVSRSPEERRGRDDGEMASGVSPTDMILERLRPLCSAESMVQLRLVGELVRDRYHQLDLGAIRAFGEERCFELVIDESGLSLVPGEASFAPTSDARLRNGRGIPASEMLSEAKHDNEGHDNEGEERLSAREELVRLADEWIAEASDEQEKKALVATKEELLAALDGRKTRM